MEIEMGPCAQFCVYHLMELDPGEERLVPMMNGEKPKDGGALLRSSVAMIGRGPRSPDQTRSLEPVSLAYRKNQPRPARQCPRDSRPSQEQRLPYNPLRRIPRPPLQKRRPLRNHNRRHLRL